MERQGGTRNSAKNTSTTNYINNNNNSNNNNNKRKEQCLTMHQPWASLLVHGIKRIEGRSWPSPLTGRLWIHAASKVPDHETVKTMENFYREIYARDGITNLEFPQHYPVSRLIGCIEVVGCLRRKELACWKEVPEGVRLEALTDFCWLCENPQKLSVPLQMGGWKGVYDLDTKINEADIGSLIRAENPIPFKFPLPNFENISSLTPGSLSASVLGPEIEKSPKLSAIIDAASQAATQYLNKGQSSQNNGFDNRNNWKFSRPNNNQYNRNYRFDNRNQRYSTRPAAANTQYVKKEHNMGSNGFQSRNQRDSYTPINTQFAQSLQIEGNNYLGNNLSTQYRSENEENCNDIRSAPRKSPQLKASVEVASQAAIQFSNKGQGSKSNIFDDGNMRNFTRPDDFHFVRKNQYSENYRFDGRNQRYSTRPAATQYVKKEENKYTPTNIEGKNFNTQSQVEKEENYNDHRSTPQIFAAAVRGIRPPPRTS